MEFALSDDQRLLEEQMDKGLSRLVPLERVRALAAAPLAFPEDVWEGMVELGLPALLVPERYGGLGLGMLDLALVAGMRGRHLVPGPFLGATVAAPIAIAAAGSPAQQAELLPGIASGTLRIGLAVGEAIAPARAGFGLVRRNGRLSGRVVFAVDVVGADMFLLAGQEGDLHLVRADARGLTVTPRTTVDCTVQVGALELDGCEVEPLADAPGRALPRLAAALRVAGAADLLGAAGRMLDFAVDYARVRRQFGRPIGAFQAVKHICAEMAAELEPGRALLWYAAHAIDTGREDMILGALQAKAYAADAARMTARMATEVHGGIGITDELGLHYWFKRISWGYQAFGGPETLRELAAGELGLLAEPSDREMIARAS